MTIFAETQVQRERRNEDLERRQEAASHETEMVNPIWNMRAKTPATRDATAEVTAEESAAGGV